MITGKIIVLRETQQITDTFKKREVVIKTPGEYPQTIPVNFMQDKVSLLDNFSVGEEVSVSYDLRGREYNGKYFSEVVGWKIESLEGRQDLPTQEEPPLEDTALKNKPIDNIPF